MPVCDAVAIATTSAPQYPTQFAARKSLKSFRHRKLTLTKCVPHNEPKSPTHRHLLRHTQSLRLVQRAKLRLRPPPIDSVRSPKAPRCRRAAQRRTKLGLRRRFEHHSELTTTRCDPSQITKEPLTHSGEIAPRSKSPRPPTRRRTLGLSLRRTTPLTKRLGATDHQTSAPCVSKRAKPGDAERPETMHTYMEHGSATAAATTNGGEYMMYKHHDDPAAEHRATSANNMNNNNSSHAKNNHQHHSSSHQLSNITPATPSNHYPPPLLPPPPLLLPPSRQLSASSMATLCNIGNTCYLNSVVYTLRFAPHFLHNLHHLVEDLAQVTQRLSTVNKAKSSSLGRNVGGLAGANTRSWSTKDLASMGGLLPTNSASELPRSNRQVATEKLHELYSSLRRSEVAESQDAFHADTFLGAVQDVSAIFEGNQQQDAHEFLMCVLDSIRETCQALTKVITDCPTIIMNG